MTRKKKHLERVASIGCVVCRFLEGWGESPAELHHPLQGGRRIADDVVIPLCRRHHRGGENNSVYVSRHPHQRVQFEKRYLTEAALLMLVKAYLSKQWPEHYLSQGEEQ